MFFVYTSEVDFSQNKIFKEIAIDFLLHSGDIVCLTVFITNSRKYSQLSLSQCTYLQYFYAILQYSLNFYQDLSHYLSYILCRKILSSHNEIDLIEPKFCYTEIQHKKN